MNHVCRRWADGRGTGYTYVRERIRAMRSGLTDKISRLVYMITILHNFDNLNSKSSNHCIIALALEKKIPHEAGKQAADESEPEHPTSL